MANIQTLSARLRAEIGDIGKSFEEQFTGDGVTKRFQLSHSPIKGISLRVYVNGVNVSTAVSVEEVNGLFQLNATPASGAIIKVSGVTYKYFTDTELGREYNLYSTVLNAPKLSEGKAQVLINTIVEQAKKLDREKLGREKYNLIKEKELDS